MGKSCENCNIFKKCDINEKLNTNVYKELRYTPIRTDIQSKFIAEIRDALGNVCDLYQAKPFTIAGFAMLRTGCPLPDDIKGEIAYKCKEE